MRTARTLPYGGGRGAGSPWRPPGQRPSMDRDPPWTETPPGQRPSQTENHLDRDPLPWTETLPDRDPPGQRPPPLDRDSLPWTETPLNRDLSLGQGPPGQRPHLWMEWQTGVKTSPSRNLVSSGKNLCVFHLRLEQFSRQFRIFLVCVSVSSEIEE